MLRKHRVLGGHITRFSVAPRSPSKMGSTPQLFHRSSAPSCFVAGKESVLCILLYTGEGVRHSCGTPVGASSVVANVQWCLHRARGKGIYLYVVWGVCVGGEA